MIVHRLFLLVLNLSFLKCASIENQAELVLEPEIGYTTASLIIEKSIASVTEADTTTSVTEQSTAVVSPKDMFSRFLTVELFHMILQYVAKSPGQMSMTSKHLRDFAGETRIFRFYEGTNWDMPELANIWKFNEKVDGDLEALTDERNMITALGNVSERSFNITLYDLLINMRSFKELVHPVLKYLIRIIKTKGFYLHETRGLLNVAIRRRFFDLIYEMTTTQDCSSIFYSCERFYQNYLHNSFDFDYLSWVYNNPSALTHVLKEKNTLPLHGKLAWAAFCIQKKAQEDYYVDYFESDPYFLLDVIRLYLVDFSLINLDPCEMTDSRTHINNLIDRYSGAKSCLKDYVSFIELLNDIRFGPEDMGIYRDRIAPRIDSMPPQTEMRLTMISECFKAASKANKKDLMFELSIHPDFSFIDLGEKIERLNPHSFKTFFDFVEIMPADTFHDFKYFKTIENFIKVIIYNKFKIIAMTSLENGNKYEIEAAEEYHELGFAHAYEIVLVNECLPDQYLKSKMFNDSAESGAVEFAQFLTENFGRHPAGVTNSHRIDVSYKFIQLLLANADLIWMLRDRNIEVYCYDRRISSESISSFSPVINRSNTIPYWN